MSTCKDCMRYDDCKYLGDLCENICPQYIPVRDDYKRGFKAGYEKGYEQGKRDAVVHARWIFRGESAGKKIYECSACKSLVHGTGIYCKYCGARMDAQEGAENEKL